MTMLPRNIRSIFPAGKLPSMLQWALLGLWIIAVFSGVFLTLKRRPALDINAGHGLYNPEQHGSFRWTSSQASFPLAIYSGPAQLRLVLSIEDWPRQPEIPVQLSTNAGELGIIPITAQPRRIYAVLPPTTSHVQLDAPAARAPGNDWRWLGVQLISITAQPAGWPIGIILQALLAAVIGGVLATLMAWAIHHQLGIVAALTLVGLALRVLWIADAPPIMHRDEVVSLVDAWSLAQTGRDHLGHVWPLAAFEAYGDWVSPMLTYVILPWIALFGPDPLIDRLVVASFGALAIPCMYGFVRELRLPTAAHWAALVTALSPWQIFLSRVAIPPAMIATSWILCMWMALRFIYTGSRRAAFWLVLAAGFALYAYPTMKMAVPLLGLITTVLALSRHGWRAMRNWWQPALLLIFLWLPFVSDTFFNPLSRARLQAVGLVADSPSALIALWWSNYRVYFQPDLYYFGGGIRKIVQGVPNHGMALSGEALLLLGLIGLPITWFAHRNTRDPAQAKQLVQSNTPAHFWIFLLGALLIAPLPASLTMGQPHAFRGALIAPIYAMLVGIGAAVEWKGLGQLPQKGRTFMRSIAVMLMVALLAWQAADWYKQLIQSYPKNATNAFFFADQELETMRRVVVHAPAFDQVWIDDDSIGRPYIFLLAAPALPASVAQAHIVVDRRPPHVNLVSQIGKYHFADLSAVPVPQNLPALEALPTRDGGPGYLLQSWQHDGQNILVVRGMSTHLPSFDEQDDDS